MLDGLGDGIPGSNFTDVFTVTAPTGPVLSIPDFARGPNGAANILIPNNTGTGIPITLTGAVAVTDVTFSLSYNPNLLNISGALSGSSGTFTLASNASGVASFVFHSGTALTGNLTLGQIVAQVPDSAANEYTAKELLHFSNIVVNSGSITAVGKDGIHVNAYLGDATGTGALAAIDASLIARASVLLDTGFAAYPLVDPAIIGDVSDSGDLTGADVTLINSYLAGITTRQIPIPPTDLTITPGGPDPSLTLPTDLQATPGGTVTVPVDIDTANPDGNTGAVEAMLALRYNPQEFDVSAADVQLGSLTSGWQLTAVVNAQTGEIGIDLFGAPIQTTAAGSLVTIALQAVGGRPWAAGSYAGASPISLVNQVELTGQREFKTLVADSQGAFVLHIENGQQTAASGQFMAANTAMGPDETVLDLQLTAHSPQPTAHYLEPTAHYFDAALAELGMMTASVTEQIGFEPAPVFDSDEGDVELAGGRGLASPLQTGGITQTDWISDDYLAYLRQSVKHAVGQNEFDDIGTDERE